MTNVRNPTTRARLWPFISYALGEGWTLEFHKPGQAPIRIGIARSEQRPTVTARAVAQKKKERSHGNE